MAHHIILIHGYSDRGASFNPWKTALAGKEFSASNIHLISYESLTNEITVKDIAEGFERALRNNPAIAEADTFDAIVHSTGMLVVRAWLANFTSRRSRLKRLIGLAPASFGSPLAHKGRGFLGSIFKGRRELGADFLEAGDQVLDNLELASRFTWDLAHEDLIGRRSFYGKDATTPYVFVFCGTAAYGGLRRAINKPGTDGTVRLAGCALNTRKIHIDLTRPEDPGPSEAPVDASLAPWSNINIPLYPVPGLNHGTILTAPSPQLVDQVARALRVESFEDFEAWTREAQSLFPLPAPSHDLPHFQQFVFRAIDERGDPIEDYNVQLLAPAQDGRLEDIPGFAEDVHAYKGDPSLRCFHVNLTALQDLNPDRLFLEITADTGSRLVGYMGYLPSGEVASNVQPRRSAALQTIQVNISKLIRQARFRLFHPFTTTLVELRLNREPLPHDKANHVCRFL